MKQTCLSNDGSEKHVGKSPLLNLLRTRANGKAFSRQVALRDTGNFSEVAALGLASISPIRP